MMIELSPVNEITLKKIVIDKEFLIYAIKKHKLNKQCEYKYMTFRGEKIEPNKKSGEKNT